jgi:hypothetical protein
MLTPLTLALVLSATPEVAVLSTAPEAEVTELRFQPLGESRLAPVVGRLTHVPRESVLGALIPGTRKVVAVAVAIPMRDLSFASSLFLLEPGKPTRVLVDRVALSTRPLVTSDGRVFVHRGRAGEGRIDALSVDEVDLVTGRSREVLAFSGYTAFLAGSLGRELLVYRVGPDGADLVAVHADALGVRVLIPKLAPLARDFAVSADGRALFFTLGDAATGRWTLERLELSTLARTRLAEGPTMALLPTPLPDGRVAFAPGQGLGLTDLEGAAVLRPGGAGYERVRAFTRKGLAVGLHETPGEFPAPLGGFAAPPQQRLDVAGVVE